MQVLNFEFNFSQYAELFIIFVLAADHLPLLCMCPYYEILKLS